MEMSKTTGTIIDSVYEATEGSEVAMQYGERHAIGSASILTVWDDNVAGGIADFLKDRVSGKTVVEIGGGIGLLGLHLAEYAKRVFVIEADPAWTWVFVTRLYQHKPKNVSFLFGAASEFAGQIRGDLALFCTHSDHAGIQKAAELFAPEVLDVYRDLMGPKYERMLRKARRDAARQFSEWNP